MQSDPQDQFHPYDSSLAFLWLLVGRREGLEERVGCRLPLPQLPQNVLVELAGHEVHDLPFGGSKPKGGHRGRGPRHTFSTNSKQAPEQTFVMNPICLDPPVLAPTASHRGRRKRRRRRWSCGRRTGRRRRSRPPSHSGGPGPVCDERPSLDRPVAETLPKTFKTLGP